MDIYDRRRERLRLLLKEISQADLGRQSGVAASYISRALLESTDPGHKNIGELTARKLEQGGRKPFGWLDVAAASEPLAAYTVNVSTVLSPRRIPLISWVRAGDWGDVSDPYNPGDADEWADAYDTQPGESAFALRVTGDSMTSPYPGARSFPDGTIIIVDPGRAANAGDYVVAKDVGTQQATFKLLASDGGRWFLRPLNPTYPTIEIDDPNMRVIGKVIEYQTRGKL